MKRGRGIPVRKLFLMTWVPSVLVITAAVIEGAWLSGWKLFDVGFVVAASVLGSLVVAGLMVLYLVLPRSEEQA